MEASEVVGPSRESKHIAERCGRNRSTEFITPFSTRPLPTEIGLQEQISVYNPQNKTAASRAERGGGDCVKSQRSLHEQGRALSAASQSETDNDQPKQLPAAKARWLPVIRLRRSQLQKIATARRDDPEFPWRKWARAVVNETMFLDAGEYDADGTKTGWMAANATTALCYGKNAPFLVMSEVPDPIRTECEAGAKDALKHGVHLLTDGATLGRAIGLTWQLQEELKTWLVWPAGATADDLEARRKARAAERKSKDRIRKQQQRREEGMTARRESIAAQARELGIKPNTLRTRLRRAAATPVTPNVPFLSTTNIEEIVVADTKGTERYTIAQQARELGITPAALRVRLYRERRRQAAPESAAPVTKGTSEAAPSSNVIRITSEALLSLDAAGRRRTVETFPILIAHLIRAAANECAGRLAALVTNAASGSHAFLSFVDHLRQGHNELAQSLVRIGADEGEIDAALCAMDFIVSERAVEARSRGVNFDVLTYPSDIAA